MLSFLSKRRAIGACVAFALLSSAPAVAQTPKKNDAAKKDKAAEKKATEAEQKPAAPAETHEEHAEEQKEASRAVFISGDIAFTRVDIGGISDNLGFDRTGANGILYGLAGGLRLKDLRFGARWRVFDTTEYNLWSIAGSVGYGLPLRPLSPIFTANVGYVWDQRIASGAFSSSLPPGTVLPPDVDVQGLLLGLDVNASYWVTQFLRVGAFIGADFMFLSRERAALPASIFPITDEFRNKPLYADTGSGVAYTLNIGLRGAFDVGF